MKQKIIVFDDDPTGIQTVHGCLIITRPDPAALRAAFTDNVDFFYILTNSRALSRPEVGDLYHRYLTLIRSINEDFGYRLQFISRSDSTLRSHFPLEINLLKQGKEWDAVFLVPAFFEGKRITKEGTHYIKTDTGLLPVAESEYARDRLFGYTSSYLPDYIEEKTEGAVKSGEVRTISLDTIRNVPFEKLLNSIRNYYGGIYVTVDAVTYPDLDKFTQAVGTALSEGKRFLFQSAASFVKAIAGVPDKALINRRDTGSGKSGVILAGSHVPATSRQLEHLFRQEGIVPIEIEVNEKMGDRVKGSIDEMNGALARRKTPVLFTSRTEVRGARPEERRKIGNIVRSALIEIGKAVSKDAGYVVVKGGITSNDVLVQSFGITTARVLGQILPGVPVVEIERSGTLHPILYVIFPGNVGSDDDLAKVYRKLR